MNGGEPRASGPPGRKKEASAFEAAPTEGVAGPSPEAMTLGELTDAAGVSVRTVRYYIAEGLLPPPDGAGPGSSYSLGHLDRLRLIQRLKAAYLPLKEIRRRLAGLDDAAVRRILAEEEVETMADASAVALDASLADARDYLALLESPARYRAEPMSLPFPTAPAAPAAAQTLAEDVPPEEGRARGGSASSAYLASPAPRAARPAPAAEPGLWRRISLGDEAELVISDRVFARHRDRVEWLVRWARKVFG